MKRIFFSKYEVMTFENNLKSVVDVILSFVKHDVSVSPFLSPDKKIQDSSPVHQQWLRNSTRMTIVDIVCGAVPNEDGRGNAKMCIKAVIPNYKTREIVISQEGIATSDIEILKKVLSNLLFDYYDYKIRDSRRHREQNVMLSRQYQQQIFSNFKSATRHNKKGR